MKNMSKRKSIFTTLIFLVILCTILLSSCAAFTVPAKMNKLQEIPTDGDYTFVGGNGITRGGNRTLYADKIKKKLSALGVKRYFANEDPDTVEYLNGKIFFVYRYYERMLEKVDGEPQYYEQKFCTGYMDAATLEVEILSTYEFIDEANRTLVSLRVVGNAAIFYSKEGQIEIYDSITGEQLPSPESILPNAQTLLIADGSAERVFYAVGESELCFVDSDGNFIEIEVDLGDFEARDLYAFTADYVIFYNYDYDINEYVYAVYDRTNYARADEETTAKVVDGVKNRDRSPTVWYGDKAYTYNLTEEQIIFSTEGEEDIVVDIQTLRESSGEFAKVEEIFGCELSFSTVKYANGEVYIIARNSDSFFGTYSHATPPIVFRYDFGGNFTYVGYSNSYSVYDIIKNY